MFYEPSKRNHGLPHYPFKAIVTPRPIGWITAMSAEGEINLAPYSYFNAVSSDPPMVMFASEGRKDSVAFIEETREFVCNLATFDLRHQMNTTSAPFPTCRPLALIADCSTRHWSLATGHSVKVFHQHQVAA